MDGPDLSRLDLGELREQARAAGVKYPPPLTNDASSRARLIDLIIQSRDAVRGLKVRRTLSWPRSWASFSLL